MKISTKTWCQLPVAISKGICVAVVSLCLCGMPTMVSASQTQSSVEQTPSKVMLKGKIVDEAGQPLFGASVSVKNTTIGMSTNKNGEFSLSVPNEKMTLVVSYMGYETVEKLINNPADEKTLNIVLKEADLSADEVVVTGLINMRKASFTGTQTTIKKEELQAVSPTNLIKAIAAFEPSFRIVENIEMGSDPNTMQEVYLRGQSGMSNRQLDVATTVSPYAAKTNPNLPVFILDGFEISMEKFNDLDPNLIESVTILKDASATALYGSRASNGVLIITSAAPEPGQLRFSYNMTASVTAPDLTDYDLLNAEEKLAQEIAAGYYAGLSAYTAANYLKAKQNVISRGVDTYWLSIPLRTQFNHSHSLNMSGGSDEFRFSIGLRYQNENGVMKESYRNVYGANLGLTYHLPGMQISNSVSVNMMERENSGYGSFGTYTKLLPYETPYDLNTGVVVPKLSLRNGYTTYNNPLYDVVNTDNEDYGSYLEFTNNFQVNWSPVQRLNVKGQFSVTKKDEDTRVFIDPASSNYADPNWYQTGYDEYGNATGNEKPTKLTAGELTLSKMSTVDWDAKFQATFSQTFDKHYISLGAGINATGSKSNYNKRTYRGFPSAEFNDPKFANTEVGRMYFDDNISRLFGAYFNGNYSYNDIYMADFSYRLDGSSKFGTDNKFAKFFSVGAGINMHNLEYFKNNLSAITQARFRANYGQTGNVSYPPFAARSTYEFTLGGYHTTGMGASLVAMGNSNLSWETTHTVNLGLDVILWGRLNLEFNWYNKLTVDLLTDVSLTPSSGFTSYKANMGEVENRGWEFKVQYKFVETKDWGFDAMVNGAHNKGVIKKISDSMKEYNDRVNDHFDKYNSTAGAQIKPVLKYEEGGSLTSIYGMKSLGISPVDGKELYLDNFGNPTFTWEGLHQRIIGDTEPALTGTFSLSFRYKKLSVHTTFNYQIGADQYNTTLIDRVENVDYMQYNVDHRIFEERWHKQGDVTKYKNIADYKTTTKPTSRFVMLNNYVNFGSLNVAYDLGTSEWVKNLGISMLRLSFNMSEIARFSTIKQERGLSYPFARTFNFSLNASF